MTSEDQDILAKIGLLAGQINRHKNQQEPGVLSPSFHTGVKQQPRPSNSRTQPFGEWRGSYRGTYSQGRGYARGGRPTQVHRNRSLVLNNGAPTPSPTEINLEVPNNESTPSSAASQAPPAWVTKTDRHLQLINPAIYEKQTQQRAKAIEETRKLKRKQRDERERLKLSRYLQRATYPPDVSGTNPARNVSYEIVVQGVRFRVLKNGSKLARIPGEDITRSSGNSCNTQLSGLDLRITGDENTARATPKSANVGGVMFFRSKNGNLYRSGVVKAYRYGAEVSRCGSDERLSRPVFTNGFYIRGQGGIKKIDEPCKAFSSTGSSFLHMLDSKTVSASGTCPKGPKCRYIHDPSTVAICKEFLQKGTCPAGEACDLSHDSTPERTPACMHFARGNCLNENCRYTHVKVSPTVPVCRPFGIYGYCKKGLKCTDRHVHECPDFSNTGVCNTKGCKLLHRSKASIIRKNTARGDQGDDAESDLSSDEDPEEENSDDVDSDDLDEEYFGGEQGENDPSIPAQQDFVRL